MPRVVRKVIIHCAATSPDMDIGADIIRDWHVKGNRWADIGYHAVIRRNGELESGRPMSRAGAHVAGHNADSIGICLVGGVAADRRTPENNFTPEQMATLERVVKDLLRRYPGATVHEHNEFAAKACPSFDVQAWWASVLSPSVSEQSSPTAAARVNA